MATPNIQRNLGESEADFRRRYHREWERLDRQAKGIKPKVKAEGPCSASDCDRMAEVKGMCGKHYRAFRHAARVEAGLPGAMKRGHHLYSIWFERKQRGSLCEPWAADFWAFVAAVGDRPGPNHLLRRISTKRPYDLGNWEWIDALKREPGETKKAFNARKWASRRQSDPDYEGRRWLMRKYGLTPADYQDMYLAQGGVCAICRQPETAVHHTSLAPKALAVDHCHKTGKVRGLLCWHCNSVLGKVKDSVTILRSMVGYLERSTNLPPS